MLVSLPMRRFLFLCATLVALTANAVAQLSVQLRVEKDTFLLYESIRVAVGIRNFSGRTIELENSGDRSWLSFMVVSESGDLMNSVGKLDTQEPVLIPGGETVSRTVDILPLYDLRERGTYQVQAVVSVNGVESVSAPVRLTIVNGRELWSQKAGLPGKENAPDEYRTYSLVARSSAQEELLHVCVKDEAHQVVYGLIPLGGFLSLTPPQARVDKEGQLHVLYQTGPRAYGYVRIDPYAKVLDRAAYSDFITRPQLAVDDGTVTVHGGEQIYPVPERVMTNNEDAVAPPPPKPKPKRHWWWPFGP